VKRAPVPIAGAVERLADELAPQTPLGVIQRHWREIAGAAVAPHAEPVSLRAGKLVVECDSAVWAQQLDLLSAEVVRRAGEKVGAEQIRALRCTAAKRRRRA